MFVTDHDWQSAWVHLLHVYLNVFYQTVAIQIKNKIVNKVEAIAHNNEWQLVRQFCLFQKVFDSLGIEAVGFATNAFDLFDLACFARGLDVFEVNVWFLAKVDYRAEKIEETFVALK
jgi:hypothetical protein